MNIISARECPEMIPRITQYIQSRWASDESMDVYTDCIARCGDTASPLPQWYMLEEDGVSAGCAGLIANDFISRQDLWPWLCALFVEPSFRGHELGRLLIERAVSDAQKAGYKSVYLCTDHIGYYEKYGFSYLATGYHPWGESSRIYVRNT